MASIHQEAIIDRSPADVWAAVRDVGALTQLVPGFVTKCTLEEGARVVTFANGMTARELIVDLDDERRRIAWSAVGTPMTHHNASLQVLPAAEGATRVVWTADLLPHALAPQIGQMIALGLQAMQSGFGVRSAR